MPRKKRGRKRVSEDDDIEVPRKRRHVADEEEAVVISDSDHEEQVKPTARETRLRARRNKAQTQGLTTTEEEEEMLSLAMKLSAEEMTNSEIRQKQEDEDMTRAIEESLNANRTQISNDNSETVLLTMTPTQGSTALLSQDPPLAPESPVFPAGEKPSCQSGSRTDPDCSSYNDAVIDMDEMKDCPQTYMPDVNESRTDTSSHLPALETSKDGEVQPSNQQSQGPSTGHLPRGRDAGDSRREGSSQGLVLCIERLSQELVAGCQTSGFVQCSQEFPVHLSPSGKLVSSLQSSTMLPQSPGFSGTDSGSLDGGAQSSARCSIPTTHSGDEGESQDFPLQEESSDTSQSLSPCKRRLALRLKRATGGGGPCGQGNHSQERSEEELPKRKSRTDPVEEGSILTASKEKDDLTSQMDLHWSEKEDEDLGTRNHRLHDSDIPGLQSTQGTDCGLGCHVPPLTSPVFPREQRPPRLCTLNPSSPSMGRPQHLTTEVSRGAGTPQRDQTRESSRVRRRFSFGKSHPSLSQGLTKSSVCQGPSEEGPELGAVHYYWGIPFCPRGQNPDQYTEVILSQLEVYEKSLKEARKTLLRKAEWGSPMIPGSLPQRARPTRPRALRPLDDGDTEAADEEEEQGDREKATVVEEEGEAKEEKNADSPVGSEGGQKDGEKSLAIWLQKRPMLCVSEELPEKQKFLRRRGRRVSSLAEGGTPQSQGQEDEETQLCSETQLSEAPLAELSRESPADTEVMVLDQEVSTPPGGGRAQQEEGTESEVEPDARAHGEWVQCPICMHRFPPTRIEIHAAYCDGLAEDPVAEEPRSRSRPFDRAHSAASGRRKWSRDAAGIDDNQPTTSANGRAQSKEKCYLCQGTFRLKDYEKHVEDCIRQSSARRDAKNLLMALDQSERNAPSSTAGPSNSTRIKGHSSVNPRDDDSLDTAALVSSSPIKSFTRISEATDCSVDFKRQHSDNPGQRGQRKRFK